MSDPAAVMTECVHDEEQSGPGQGGVTQVWCSVCGQWLRDEAPAARSTDAEVITAMLQERAESEAVILELEAEIAELRADKDAEIERLTIAANGVIDEMASAAIGAIRTVKRNSANILKHRAAAVANARQHEDGIDEITFQAENVNSAGQEPETGWLAPRTGGYTPADSGVIPGPPPPGPGASSVSNT